MASMVTFSGAVILALACAAVWMRAAAALAQHLQRRAPDPTLTPIGHKFRRGCDEFDHRKYLDAKVRRARLQLAASSQRYAELRAARLALDGSSDLPLLRRVR